MTGQGRYGLFLYGDVEPRPLEGIPPGRPKRDPSPTEVEALGAGVALNPHDLPGYDWDFRIDASGALETTEGLDEYAKDMAFATARESGNLLGKLTTEDDLADLELDLRFIMQTDARTKRVQSIAVRRERGVWDTVTVETSLVAEDNEFHDLIFPIFG